VEDPNVNEEGQILTQIKKRRREVKERKREGLMPPTPPSPPCPPGMLALKRQESETEAKIARTLLDSLVASRVWEILPATAEDEPSSVQVIM